METEGPQFLKEKYSLQASPEVAAAAKRTEERTGETVPQKPVARIQNFLDRLTAIAEHENPATGEPDDRGVEKLKHLLHKKYVITEDRIPQEHFDLQGSITDERGQRQELIDSGVRIEEFTGKDGQRRKHYYFPENSKQQLSEVVIADQESSLDNWVDYLASPDAMYPDWLKYHAVGGMLELGKYDKEKHAFAPRAKDTVAPFPDLNREALAYVLDALIKKYGNEYFRLLEEIEQSNSQLLALAQYEYQQQLVLAAANQPQEPAAKLRAITLPNGRVVRLKQIDFEQLQQQLTPEPPFERPALEHALATARTQLDAYLEAHNLPEPFRGLPQIEDFGKLYVWALEKVTPAAESELANTKGEWAIFPKGCDPITYIPAGFTQPLVPSLQGHGTGWCTAGESTARTQLAAGDFYVYYSLNDQGQPTVPRAAIRMEGSKIGEVRGIAAQQNLDPYIAPKVREKLQARDPDSGELEFPDGAAYAKKARDMQKLTMIERKAKVGQPLEEEDLTFLYELDAPIQGFGYQKDPRVAELRASREDHLELDQQVIFGCEGRPELIARNAEQITPATKAYIGPLEAGIFDKVAQYDIKHIYTVFPEGKIRREPPLTIGGKTKEQLKQELKDEGYNFSYAEQMMDRPEFTTLTNPDQIYLIRLRVADLGFPRGATTAEIIGTKERNFTDGAAYKLGLDVCPAEVGPQYRLNYPNQPMNEYVYVGMEPIADADGDPDVFDVNHDEDDRWLSSFSAYPSDRWDPGDKFLFRLRKSTETLTSLESLSH